MARHTITIEYCPKCNWMLRAAYFAQEFLSSFTENIQGLTLVPSEQNGSFIISVDGIKIFDRIESGGFPEIKVLKQMVRDRVAPHQPLGHADTPSRLKS
ncbi:MAG TPA: SelT/SelW/SelH family protein [Saprospiraceae bacterium]|nr:SelT/SelW/SelH family protein [Saprospiraceae bacterium]HNT19192.1 SelT/SelW/SelH family protein [Saprospiraceae bacterium]